VGQDTRKIIPMLMDCGIKNSLSYIKELISYAEVNKLSEVKEREQRIEQLLMDFIYPFYFYTIVNIIFVF
jgi:hypothetical protein